MRHRGPFSQTLLSVLTVGLVHIAGVAVPASAQTAPITSSGLNTHISGPIPVNGAVQYDITGGTRPNGGPNLFHSFGEFGVPNNHIANFVNNSGLATSNILGRVTGGNVSNILGAIQTSDFGNANLFLMNPAGFLFGPNATVHVGGMATFTTADYLRLSDGTTNGFFYADPSKPSLLTAAPVAAFGFLGSNPGAITVQGSHLAVTEGTGLSLVGGTITIESGTLNDGTVKQAHLTAPNGQIQLAGTASPGEFDTTLQPLQNVNGTSFTSSGSITLAPNSTVNVNGTNTVAIRGGQFVLSVTDAALSTAAGTGTLNSISLSPASSIISSTAGTEPGADILIATPTLQVDGAQLSSMTTGSGKAGNISINADSVTLSSAYLSAETNGPGAGGTIMIDTAGTISLENFSIISALSANKGPAGNIVLKATDSILLKSGSAVSSDAASFSFSSAEAGDGGLINLRAPRVEIHDSSLLSSSTLGAGKGGTVLIEAQQLNMGTDADISAFTQGPGRGGTITIRGLDGEASRANDVALSGGSVLRSRTSNEGNAGEIKIAAAQLLIDNSQINANSETGSGAGGNIALSANSLTVQNGGTVSAATSGNTTSATGGTIAVNADHVQLISHATVTTNSTGAANAGNITFQATNILLEGGTNISSTTSGAGNGGTVALDAGNSISLVNSTIASNSQPTSGAAVMGDGGQVDMRSPHITLEQGSAVLARTTEAGRAGTIQINTNHLGLSDMSTAQTSTQNIGAAGNLTVQGLGGSGTKAQTISLTGGSSLSSASLGNDEGKGGAAGNILLDTQRLNMSGGSSITTSSSTSSGDAGTITIHAGEDITLSQSAIRSRSESNIPDEFVRDVVIGNAGSIILAAPTISLKNGSQTASTTNSRYPGDPSKGNGGSITINATDLRITEGSQVLSSSVTDDSGQPPVGNAGRVTVQGLHGPAQSVYIDGQASGIFTDTQGKGVGGNITLNANQIQLNSGAIISANSAGAADAGSINLTATDGLTMRNSSITTLVAQNHIGNTDAHGGNIKVTTSPAATIYLQNSEISASVPGSGNGGNITIDPQFVILQGSQILAQTDRGTGGNITITTSVFQPDATSIVNADANRGVNGTVTIQSPNAPASGKIQPLGNRPLQATSLLNQRCAAVTGGRFSSFTMAGRDSLPMQPGGWLSSPLALAIPESHGATLNNTTLRAGLEELTGELPLLSLRQIAPPGFLTQTFASDRSTGCRS